MRPEFRFFQRTSAARPKIPDKNKTGKKPQKHTRPMAETREVADDITNTDAAITAPKSPRAAIAMATMNNALIALVGSPLPCAYILVLG